MAATAQHPRFFAHLAVPLTSWHLGVVAEGQKPKKIHKTVATTDCANGANF
jgi:hypothetical protein